MGGGGIASELGGRWGGELRGVAREVRGSCEELRGGFGGKYGEGFVVCKFRVIRGIALRVCFRITYRKVRYLRYVSRAAAILMAALD